MTRKPTHPKSRLVPFSVASAESGIPYGSLRDAALRGELPVVKINRNWYLERADLARFIDGRKEVIGGSDEDLPRRHRRD